MAVTLRVNFEESPQLILDLNTLQFVGIADHSQLKNRDMREQHPMSAITGLEKFKNNIATQNDIQEVLDHE